MSAPADATIDPFRACVHCGLCLEHCPTYTETGHEADSPRGRIVLMRGVADGRLAAEPAVRRHLDLCLDCRACQTACPSGVRYGELLEGYRASHPLAPKSVNEWLRDRLLLDVLPHAGRVRRLVMLGRIVRALGAFSVLRSRGLSGIVPAWVPRLEGLLPRRGRRCGPLRESYPVRGKPRGRVFFFAGCAGEALLPETNRATLRVLGVNQYAVACPPGQRCCGAIHFHAGRLDEARAMARVNVDAFEGDDPIVNNAAGCGAMLRHYGRLLAADGAYAERARRFSARVDDASAWLASRSLSVSLRRLAATVAYHDPCHLCHAQGIRREPRELLRSIPGLNLVAIGESEMCCGAAGSYTLREPRMSAQLARRKLDHVRASGASIVATGNIGCILQLRAAAAEAGVPLDVVHPLDLLARAYADAPSD